MENKKIKFQFLNKINSIILGGLFIWGLLFAGWSPMLVIAGYWIEELLTFLLTGIALLILRISGRKPVHFGKFLLVLGSFFIAHTIFIIILAGFASKSDPMAEQVFLAIFYPIARVALELDPGFLGSMQNIAVVAFLGLLFNLYRSVFSKGKWRTVDTADIVNRSFGAFIAPHLVIILGMGTIILTSSSGYLAIVLVLIKVIIDISGFGDKGGQIIEKEGS